MFQPLKLRTIQLLVWPTSHVGMLHPCGGEKPRAQSDNFCEFVRSSLAKIGYSASKPEDPTKKNQYETRKSLYEEIGLAYVASKSDKITITDVGMQLYKLISEQQKPYTEDFKRRATAILAFALSRSQIYRPQSRGSPKQPKNDLDACRVRPYALAWQAVLDLDGFLTMDEFGAVLCRISDPSQYDDAIAKINKARDTGKPFQRDVALSDNFFIYWKSHLTVANTLLIEEEGQAETILRLNKDYRSLLTGLMRFGRSCGNSKEELFSALNWGSIEEYYSSIAGVTCPPFMETPEPKIINVAGTAVTDLSSYELRISGRTAEVVGGPELCNLPILTPCIHSLHREYLLRLDTKNRLKDGRIELGLGRGRPIVRPDLIFSKGEA
ncbi:hypothetical protein FHT79_003449 [Rhizobium sp. BK212]|uniref:hypothetical protein n=1 Tax=Rhizobium sp. BK212 TaxID=2587074 RepID=UPI00161E4C52|nr:hypothetical protein [Rhizobium sp. BK212]MBB4216262.1 hypothetical protein [Rhizobium sp. BK212]